MGSGEWGNSKNKRIDSESQNTPTLAPLLPYTLTPLHPNSYSPTPSHPHTPTPQLLLPHSPTPHSPLPTPHSLHPCAMSSLN
ncbi:MAG: hypothetical protein DSM106950_03255 [Stigonema ocellatum SAG 48.90 = DSM 106950]|nr:hypothetical protein [Stigonema ocellatum SAG 48.90 = DSM 106950]